jgi:hypothetical protein
MVVNFRTRKINRDIRKLLRTPTLIEKKKPRKIKRLERRYKELNYVSCALPKKPAWDLTLYREEYDGLITEESLLTYKIVGLYQFSTARILLLFTLHYFIMFFPDKILMMAWKH